MRANRSVRTELCCQRRMLGRKPSAKPRQEPSCSLWHGEASREATQTVSAMKPPVFGVTPLGSSGARRCVYASMHRKIRGKNHLHVCGSSMSLKRFTVLETQEKP